MKGCRSNLRKSCKVSLTITCNAALHQDSTIPLNTHCSSFLWYTRSAVHCSPRDFCKRREANSKERGIVFLPLFPLLFSPTGIVGQFKRSIESCLVIAAIVLSASQSFIRKVFLRNEITPANLSRIKSQFMSNAIDCSLQHVRCFGPTCSPISASWNLIGEDAHNLTIHCLNLIW